MWHIELRLDKPTLEGHIISKIFSQPWIFDWLLYYSFTVSKSGLLFING